MPTLLTSGLFIEHLAHSVRNYRIWRRGAYQMALKLTRISNKAMDARANVEKLEAAYDRFNNKAVMHIEDVDGLANQVSDMDDDLNHAVGIMGNSVASSNAGAEKQVITPAEVGAMPPAIQQPETPKTNPPPSNGQQTIIGDQRSFDRIGG